MTGRSLCCVYLAAFGVYAGEADHIDTHCRGEVEVTLRDQTRVDCLTDSVAWEYDFGPKWAESVGQALHYARMTGREPGVVLILSEPSESRYLSRLEALRDAYVPSLHIHVVHEIE